MHADSKAACRVELMDGGTEVYFELDPSAIGDGDKTPFDEVLGEVAVSLEDDESDVDALFLRQRRTGSGGKVGKFFNFIENDINGKGGIVDNILMAFVLASHKAEM